jgi:hypothetical protein
MRVFIISKKTEEMIMKVARIGSMVLGLVLSMFVIAQYASAQALPGEWFKGKASLKGYEIGEIGGLEGKARGSATIYVHIVQETDTYTVTTCVEDTEFNNLWRLGEPNIISKGKTYGDPNKKMIWDFADGSVMQFYGPIYTYPMFYVKLNGSLSKADFESFACHFWDDSVTPNFQLGSCSITFKNIDVSKVPTGPLGCIIDP